MSEQRNALDAGGHQREGEDQNTNSQGGEPIMHIISDPGSKYNGYTVRAGDDIPGEPSIAEDVFGRGFMRISCRVSRIPSRTEFLIRSLAGASEEERAQDLRTMASIHRTFEVAEAAGAVERFMNKTGRFWSFFIWMGTPIDDPLVQLELEMMIDLHSGVQS